MLTLDGLIIELEAIRNFLDQVEVKGQANRAALSLCYDKCSNLIADITAIINEAKNQNGSANQGEEVNISEKG